jgi:acyl carrier protein
MATSVTDHIKRLIVEQLDIPTPPGFDESTPLYDGGMAIDSFTTVELITLIEKQFDIEFDVEHIRPEHFVNINTLGNLVERYLSSR